MSIDDSAALSNAVSERKTRRTRPSFVPIPPAPTQTSSPAVHIASRSAGRYSPRRGARTSTSSDDADQWRPRQLGHDVGEGLGPLGRRTDPLPRREERPVLRGSTASTSRSAARVRRRIMRNTSGSQNSVPEPPGRESHAAPVRRPRARQAPTAPSRPGHRAGGRRRQRRTDRGSGSTAAPRAIAEVRRWIRCRQRAAPRQRDAEGVVEAPGVGRCW